LNAQFVLDNSIILAWLFHEGEPDADRIMDRLVDGAALAPGIWPLEFANTLVVARRRKRLLEAEAVRAREVVLALPIEIVPDDSGRVLSTVMALAHDQGLSVYDACYLDLAMREGLPLATLDRQLSNAARRCSVPLLTGAPVKPSHSSKAKR